MNNSRFVMLVSGSWVGTIEQSEMPGQLIRKVLATGKTATIAIRDTAEPDGATMAAAE